MPEIHKIGLLSDTHLQSLSADLLKKCRKHFADCPLIFHAGDVTAPGVLAELETYGWKVIAVRGNMDVHPELGNLPVKRVIRVGELSVGLCHGWGAPASIKERILGEFSSPPPIIVYGHTHQFDDSHYAGVRFLNPGSPTDKRWAPFVSMARLVVEGKNALCELIRI